MVLCASCARGAAGAVSPVLGEMGTAGGTEYLESKARGALVHVDSWHAGASEPKPGTAFVVAQEGSYAYLLTALHVFAAGRNDTQVVRVRLRGACELFASGSSSLEALLQSVRAGHRVFHVDDLHAKLVLTRGTACVGSQNLTARGQRNREASVLFQDVHALRALRQQINPWLTSAREIRQPEIERLLRELPTLRKAFRRYRRELVRSAERVQAAERKERSDRRRTAREEQQRRRAEYARQAESDRLQKEQSERWREQIHSSDAARHSVELQLRRFRRMTLARRNANESLTRWHLMDGAVVELARTQRYLMVDYHTGQLTWPAVFRSRLSVFGTGLFSDEPIAFGDVHASVQFDTHPDEVEPPGNVMFKLRYATGASRTPRQRRNHNAESVRLVARFDLDRFELLSILSAPGSEHLFWTMAIQHHMNRNPQQFANQLREILLKSFKYKRNRSGLRAHQILPSGATVCSVQLYRRNAQPFLVLRY